MSRRATALLLVLLLFVSGCADGTEPGPAAAPPAAPALTPVPSAQPRGDTAAVARAINLRPADVADAEPLAATAADVLVGRSELLTCLGVAAPVLSQSFRLTTRRRAAAVEVSSAVGVSGDASVVRALVKALGTEEGRRCAGVAANEQLRIEGQQQGVSFAPVAVQPLPRVDGGYGIRVTSVVNGTTRRQYVMDVMGFAEKHTLVTLTVIAVGVEVPTETRNRLLARLRARASRHAV